MNDTKDDLFEKLTRRNMTPEDREKFLKNYEKEFKEAFAPDPEDSLLPADKDPRNKDETGS